ncbi:MAG: hypothetical protein FJ098_11755 [Deltaproteobacteria bacterium]|nr:hypothetical protein [Deltaproteobacteria bacterium]
MSRHTKIAIASLVGGLTALALMLGLGAAADGLQSTDQVPRLLLYHSTLERDGQPVHATFEMTFSLYDGSGAAAAAWTETLPVTVYGGRFSAVLGNSSQASASALAEVVRKADDLYLGITILEDGAAIPLGNRQRFLPLPYTHWSWQGTDLVVNALDGAGTEGRLHLNPNTKGMTETGGELAVYGPDIDFLTHPSYGNGGRALVHGTSDRLIVNFAEDFAGGVRLEGPFTTSPNKLVTMHQFSFGQANEVNTQVSIDQWTCAIAGVQMLDGELDGNGSDEVLRFHTYRDFATGTWWVSMDIDSEGNHEEHEAGIVCFANGITELDNWWSKN